MKTNRRVVLLFSCLLATWIVPAAAQDAQDTQMQGVTARLAFARQSNGLLRVGIVLKNTGAKEMIAGEPIAYSNVVLLDAKSRKKQFALKDAKGHYLAGPTSDWNNGGRWVPHLEPHLETLFWFYFDAVPAGSTVSIQVPQLQPFDDVVIQEGPLTAADSALSAAPLLQASVMSATRADGQVKVRLKIANPGKAPVTSGRNVYYEDAFIFDPQSKQMYSVMKDTEGSYDAMPVSDRDHGGRWFLQKAVPGQTFMNLTFQAPPDTVTQVDVIIPWFAPLQAVQLSGEGGAASAGSAVAGKALDMQGALRDLHAEVTGQQIKVNLAADLLFDFDKAEIKPGAEPTLDKVVTVLKASPGASLSVEGHTDGKGTDAYNVPLSEKRAVNVAQWLASRANLPAASVRTKGWGKSKPIAPNATPDGSDDPEGRAKNRRVEIIVTRQ